MPFLDSNKTDTTWKIEFSEDEFESADTTFENNNIDIITDSIMVPMNVINVDSFEESPKPAPQAPKRRGRPPGSKNSSRGGTPLRSCHAYNLRQRKQNQTFNGFDHNPVLDTESPDTFGNFIADLAKKSKV